MKLKKHIKRRIIYISVLLITLIIFMILKSYKNKSYSLEYKIEDYSISENYDDEFDYYFFDIRYNKKVYSFIYEQSYIKEKKLINNVKNITEDNFECLIVQSEFMDIYPLCSKDQQLIDYNLVSDELKEQFDNYEINDINNSQTIKNYQIYSDVNNLLIWSYKGFDYFQNNELKHIELFSKDIYEIPLATKINNYLILPNYEQEHEFDEILIIDLENYKVDKWKLKNRISFNSTILGINEKSLFLLDKDNKIEYEIVPHKQKIRIVGTKNKKGIVYNELEPKKISLSKIISNELNFTYYNKYNYSIIKDNLYLNYQHNDNKIKVSDKKVKKIIYINNNDVYYLVDETLYKYNPNDGEKRLINYSEWKYNYQNNIFINN